VNYQVGDGGCSATAFLTGIKTNFGVISMSGNVPLNNCSAQADKDNHVDSIFKFAQEAGKATGIVTNMRVTHATPAGELLWKMTKKKSTKPPLIFKAAYAKSASRYWENNEQTPAGCRDIAVQLVHGEIGKRLDVILGGGYREFLPNNRVDPFGRFGNRTDNRDLIAEWRSLHRNAGVVFNRVSRQ
jgi:alkaline phosphatase